MEPVIELEECVRDSPKFKFELERQMQSIDTLECKLEKLLKQSQNMIDTGKEYLSAQTNFQNSLNEIGGHFKDDPVILSAFNKCSTGFTEISKFQSTLLDQINRAICKNIADFLKYEVKPCRDNKINLDKLHQEYYSCVLKNSAIPAKGKLIEADEASKSLIDAKNTFRSASLDLVHRISVLQQKKRFEILDNVLQALNAQKTFFHEGYDFFKDDEKTLKSLHSEVTSIQGTLARDAERLIKNRHNLIYDTPEFKVDSNSSNIKISGYLSKRGFSKTFKSWKRRWFELLNKGQLVYRKRFDETPTILEEDLRICLVRPMADCDRRFCFELISPNKTHVLQADSQQIFSAWVSALQSAISCAIHNSSGTLNDSEDGSVGDDVQNNSKMYSDRSRIISAKGNDLCCDCGTPDPEWASVNLGITLCIKCSGIHRSLGVHHSKVKSLGLDTWEQESLGLMQELGNDVVNSIYLAKTRVMESLGIEQASPECPEIVREVWIKAKYVDRAFVHHPKISRANVGKWTIRKKTGSNQIKEDTIVAKTLSSENGCELNSKDLISKSTLLQPSATDLIFDEESLDSPGSSQKDCPIDCNLLLYRAARAGNVPVMCEAVALGADRNWKHPMELSSVLHQAVIGESVSACEFLLLNGAKIDVTDGSNRTPIWLATQQENTVLVCILLRWKADITIADNQDNKLPLHLALSSKHVDIVTLLRYAKMAVELASGETSQCQESLQDLIRDISQRAHDPGDRDQQLLTADFSSQLEISSNSSRDS